jgi:hypothetical protein
MEEKWTAEQTTCLARELMFRCLSYQDTFSSGNLYSGGLGASYLLYDYSQHVRRQQQNNSNNNASPSIYRSKRPLQQACEGAEHAVRHPSYQRSKKRQASMFESEWIGAHCLYAITLFHLGKKRQSKDTVSKVLQRISNSCTTKTKTTSIKNNVATGRAGALQAIWWLRDELQIATIGSTLVVKLAKAILQDITKTTTTEQPHHNVGGGAARGQVGILYTLLGLSPKEWDLVEQDIPNARATMAQTIDAMLLLQLQLQLQGDSPNETTTTCTVSHQNNNTPQNQDNHIRVDWSHGATGLVLLLIRASQVFNNIEYLKQAYVIAETVLWPRGVMDIRKGVGLAFGSSGVAICFLLLSQYCLKPLSTLWHRRAQYYAQWAIHNWDAYLEMERELPTGWNIYSLYEGLGGLVTLLLNLHPSSETNTTINTIHMPLYSMGWVYPSKTLLAEEDVVPQQQQQEQDPTTNDDQGGTITAVPENSTVPESTTPVVPVVVVVVVEAQQPPQPQSPEEEKPPQTKPVPPEEETPSPKQEEKQQQLPPTAEPEPEPSSVKEENDHHPDETPEQQSPTTTTSSCTTEPEPEPPSVSVIRRHSSEPTPHHFVVPTNKSIFWSLQTESHIGTCLSYKPAMVVATTTATTTSPPKTDDPHVTTPMNNRAAAAAASIQNNTTESGSHQKVVPFDQTPELSSTRSKSFTYGDTTTTTTTAIPPPIPEDEPPKAKATTNRNNGKNSKVVPNAASRSVKTTRPGLLSRSPPKSTAAATTRVLSATRRQLPPLRSPPATGVPVRSSPAAAAKSRKIISATSAEKCAVRRAEEEVRSKQAREARRKAQEEARLRVEKQARLRAEKVARVQAETEARQKAIKDARRKRDAEAQLKAQRTTRGSVEG